MRLKKRLEKAEMNEDVGEPPPIAESRMRYFQSISTKIGRIYQAMLLLFFGGMGLLIIEAFNFLREKCKEGNKKSNSRYLQSEKFVIHSIGYDLGDESIILKYVADHGFCLSKIRHERFITEAAENMALGQTEANDRSIQPVSGQIQPRFDIPGGMPLEAAINEDPDKTIAPAAVNTEEQDQGERRISKAISDTNNKLGNDGIEAIGNDGVYAARRHQEEAEKIFLNGILVPAEDAIQEPNLKYGALCSWSARGTNIFGTHDSEEAGDPDLKAAAEFVTKASVIEASANYIEGCVKNSVLWQREGNLIWAIPLMRIRTAEEEIKHPNKVIMKSQKQEADEDISDHYAAVGDNPDGFTIEEPKFIEPKFIAADNGLCYYEDCNNKNYALVKQMKLSLKAKRRQKEDIRDVLDLFGDDPEILHALIQDNGAAAVLDELLFKANPSDGNLENRSKPLPMPRQPHPVPTLHPPGHLQAENPNGSFLDLEKADWTNESKSQQEPRTEMREDLCNDSRRRLGVRIASNPKIWQGFMAGNGGTQTPPFLDGREGKPNQVLLVLRNNDNNDVKNYKDKIFVRSIGNSVHDEGPCLLGKIL